MIRAYKPNKSGNYSGQYLITSYNMENKVWEYLRRFRNKDYCTNKLKELILPSSTNYSKITTKAEHISAAIVQAESYYQSARTASLEVKPLLLYYGMVGLAKCLIMLGDNEYTLASDDISNENHSQHGLSNKVKRGYTNDETARDGNELSPEFCYIKSAGLYPLLRDCYSVTKITNGERLTVKDLLSLFPETQKDYFEYYKEAPRVWRCDGHYGKHITHDNYQLIKFIDYDTLFFRTSPTDKYEDVLKNAFPELTTKYVVDGACYLSTNEIVGVDDGIYLSESLNGASFAFCKIRNIGLSDIDIHFLLMFILSNIVRYRQDKWSNLINRTFNNDFSMIESFLEVSQVKFPMLVLRELESKDYEFVERIARWG